MGHQSWRVTCSWTLRGPFQRTVGDAPLFTDRGREIGAKNLTMLQPRRVGKNKSMNLVAFCPAWRVSTAAHSWRISLPMNAAPDGKFPQGACSNHASPHTQTHTQARVCSL